MTHLLVNYVVMRCSPPPAQRLRRPGDRSVEVASPTSADDSQLSAPTMSKRRRTSQGRSRSFRLCRYRVIRVTGPRRCTERLRLQHDPSKISTTQRPAASDVADSGRRRALATRHRLASASAADALAAAATAMAKNIRLLAQRHGTVTSSTAMHPKYCM